MSISPPSCFGRRARRKGDRGLPPLPPRWVFEGFKWEDNYLNYLNVLNDATKHRLYDIPIGAIIIERPWSTAYNSWIFAESFHQSSEIAPGKKMIDKLHEMGYRVLVWCVPYINCGIDSMNSYDLQWEREAFAYGDKNGYFLRESPNGPTAIRKWWRGSGGLIDFTNREAVEWWHSLMDPIFEILHIDGVQVDHVAGFRDGERLYGKKGWIDHKRYTELYYRDMQVYIFKKTKGQGIAMHRPSSHGTYYGEKTDLNISDVAMALWTGDPASTFEDYVKSIEAIFRLNVEEGLPYAGADVGGIVGDFNRELFLRWCEFAAFTPIFIHSRILWRDRVRIPADSVGDPGNCASDPGIEDDEEALSIYRYYVTLHRELVPYTYSLAHIAHQTGIGIIRAPNIGKPFSETYEYLYGDSFLVAPVIKPLSEGGDKRSVEIPEGCWIDYWTDKEFVGPCKIDDYPTPLDKIPIFIRAGSIIPMEVSSAYTGHGEKTSKDYLTIDIYPHGVSKIEFFSDGAGSKPYMFSVEENLHEIKINLEPSSECFILRVRSSKPSVVKINDVEIRDEGENFWLNQREAFYYDLNQKRVYIRTFSRGMPVEVRLLK
ncbi:MAG: glycoside hydrolase family 31 protein [Candidatus Bathyarchaeia archaeon]